ncbi:MAG: hypothetical protein FJ293_11725 [Planctomycetes bacterium]|nr:hypothetical protein [Planctomycetota bacterium]
MRIHCDHCGRVLDSAEALRQRVDDEQLWFCSEACATAGAPGRARRPAAARSLSRAIADRVARLRRSRWRA